MHNVFRTFCTIIFIYIIILGHLKAIICTQKIQTNCTMMNIINITCTDMLFYSRLKWIANIIYLRMLIFRVADTTNSYAYFICTLYGPKNNGHRITSIANSCSCYTLLFYLLRMMIIDYD